MSTERMSVKPGNSRLDIDRFATDGYLILKGVLGESSLLSDMRSEIEELGRSFDSGFQFDDARSVSALGGTDRSAMYRALRYLPSLAAAGASPLLVNLCRDLGLRMPALMRSYNIRMDMPCQDEFLFHWHQDITYLLGSRNSVTLWLPLGSADRLHGTIEVLPSSHHDLAPFRIARPEAAGKTSQLSPNDIRLSRDPDSPGEVVEAEWGDVVVFSQLLLHRSLPNRSTRPRWTVQLRYSDLADAHFRQSGYPFGDATTILHTDYLGAWRTTALGGENIR
jgi:hypothetical protein